MRFSFGGLRRAGLLLLALSALAPTSAQAAQRWASPASTVTSGSCDASSPCQIDFAVNGAGSGDEVIVGPGDYTVTTTLSPSVSIYMHGVAGQPRPRLLGTSSPVTVNFKKGGTLRHLAIQASGGGQDALTLQDSVGEDLILRSSDGDAAKVVVSPSLTVLRDTVAYTTATGAGVAALKLRDGGGGGDLALRNVTAYGSGGSSNGIRCETNVGTSSLVNVIARGAGADIDASVSGVRCEVSHSAFRPELSPGLPAGTANRSSDPQFVDAANGDFHLADGSPLIDGGTSDSLLGTVDPDGRSRTLGFAPDIGAYEHGDFFLGTGAATIPAPVLGSTVTVATVKGTVIVRLPNGKRFRLGRSASIPVGSRLDTRRGTVALRAALDGLGATQTGRFRGGVFEVRQKRTGGGVTEILLRGGNFGRCRARRAAPALAVASRSRRVRRLWSRDRSGRFRTHGRNSIATARGTAWLTVDRCDGTLTSVSEGAVAVRDRHRRRSVLVRAGSRHLARAHR